MEKYRMNPKQIKLIDEIVISIGLLAIIVFLLLACNGCLEKNKLGVNDNPVTANITTTMPVTIDPVIKPQFQSPEQTSEQKAKSGGNTYQTNVSMAGGGAVAGLMFLMIGVLGWKYLQSDKALHAVTSAIEGFGHPAKRASQYEATAIGAEKYLRKKVKKWYPK